MIPFSPPRIDERTIAAVTEALRSGWITTGPRTKAFEKKLSEYTGAAATVCVSSATAGLELILEWFGVGPGDEVIIPAYTYCATANVVMHRGAKPVMVDVNAADFCLSPAAVARAITPQTKVVMPVDFGGYPCDYDELYAMVAQARSMFRANGSAQEQLGRILVLADAAHSLGARYRDRRVGSVADVSVFSFHAVKNLTTAEGGGIALNLPAPFDAAKLYAALCVKSLHGQTKDALAKTKAGQWKYDVVEAGHKCNMTDIQASIGLVELERYENDTLVQRAAICEEYRRCLASRPWAELPLQSAGASRSSFHLFPLRIRGIAEAERDAIITEIATAGVSVNVHFQPLPLLKYYRERGYRMEDYPVAYDAYAREISLPVFYDLQIDQARFVADVVAGAVATVTGR